MQSSVNFKLIVLGAQGVGKSSLITRYIKGQFCESYHVTVGVQFATKVVQVAPNTLARLQIWDTAGQQFFRSLVRTFYKGIAAVFLVFALDSADSFKQLVVWVEQLRQNSHQQVILFLIGARSDIENKRQVSQEQASQFARKIDCALYIETSAKTGENIQLLFDKAANILYKKYQSNPDFKCLVQPDEPNSFLPDTRTSRTHSMVLKSGSLPNRQNVTSKKKCCH